MLSIGAELLYKIVEEKDYRAVLRLREELFEDNEKNLLHYLTNYINKYNTFPELEVFIKRNNLNPDPILEPLEAYFDQVFDRYDKKLIIENMADINKQITSGNISKAISIFDSISEKSKKIRLLGSNNLFTQEEAVNLALQASEKNRLKHLNGIPTGWKTLDNAIKGFNNGNLYVVIARVKMGKSMVLIKMAREAYTHKYKTMFFSLEMPLIEIADRLTALEYGIGKNYITKGRLSSFREKEIKEDLEAKKGQEDYFRFVEGKFSTSIEEIEMHIQQYKPDIVFIDGAYLLRSKKFFKAKWELVTYTAEQLKLLATNLDIPIVASYQFNRNISRKSDSVADKGFESIGLSDAIAQLTSAGIALLKPNDTDRIRTVEIFGSRDGGEDRFDINWDFDYMNFDEINPPIQLKENNHDEDEEVIDD